MKHLREVCLVALTLTTGITASVAAQSLVAAGEKCSFAGTWKGRMNDLPGINLTIREADRKISGAIVFYFQQRLDPNSPWHIAGKSAVPLLAPRVESRTLTFEVQHRQCHGCRELGPNVKFRMALAGPNQARLWNLDEGDSAPGLTLIRATEAPARMASAPQQGISVQLAVTHSGIAMPDADKEDAAIVTITHDGSVYFGIEPIAPTALAEKIKVVLSNRAEEKIYIKAAARAPYATVAKVLDAARTAGIEAPGLLTSQPESAKPGMLLPPKGLEVLIGAPAVSSAESLVVQVLNSGQRWPKLKVNNDSVPWAELQSALTRIFQSRSEKTVWLKADGLLSFAQVAHVIDICRSTGAKVVLITP